MPATYPMIKFPGVGAGPARHHRRGDGRAARPGAHRHGRNPVDLELLDVYCHRLLRRAADLLHLHHSNVARRLEQLGKTLGIELTEHIGLIRARLALTAWRLLDD